MTIYEALKKANNKIIKLELAVTELRSTMSENNEFYGDQMMNLNAENAELKIKLRMREVS